MKRALVVASSWHALPWRANSAACFARLLEQRGFAVRRLDDAAASRAGILAAYDELIDATQDGDAAAFYYVGHGGQIRGLDYQVGDAIERDLRHLCPSDYAETTPSDFRGICRFELAAKLSVLARKTRNVTAVLECCYAGLMSRDVQSRQPYTKASLTAHVDRVRAELPAPSEAALADVICVGATDQVGCAREMAVPVADFAAVGIAVDETQPIGELTAHLALVLGGIGDRRVPWRTIAPVLRSRVYWGRPEIEGPMTRVPFSLDSVDDRSLPVRPAGGSLVVEAGALEGVTVGDRYAVVAVGTTKPLAYATVETVDALESLARSEPPSFVPPQGARVLPVAVGGPRMAVRVRPPNDAGLLAALAATGDLRSATGEEPAAAAVERIGADLQVRDDDGVIFASRRIDDAIQVLGNIAAARRLRMFAEDSGIAPAALDIEVGRVEQGSFIALRRHGASLRTGEHVAVRVHNRSDAPCYAHVFNVGVDSAIAPMTWGNGRLVLANDTLLLGTSGGSLVGWQARWPAGMSTHRPRIDSIAVLITAEPRDLSGLVRLTPDLARTGTEPLPRFAIFWREFLLTAA